jgi:hypothetical protein
MKFLRMFTFIVVMILSLPALILATIYWVATDLLWEWKK